MYRCLIATAVLLLVVLWPHQVFGQSTPNVVPSSGTNNIALNENEVYRFSVDDFYFSDQNPEDTLHSIRLNFGPTLQVFDTRAMTFVQGAYKPAHLYLDANDDGLGQPEEEVEEGDIIAVDKIKDLMLVPAKGSGDYLYYLGSLVASGVKPGMHYSYVMSFSGGDGEEYSWYEPSAWRWVATGLSIESPGTNTTTESKTIATLVNDTYQFTEDYFAFNPANPNDELVAIRINRTPSLAAEGNPNENLPPRVLRSEIADLFVDYNSDGIAQQNELLTLGSSFPYDSINYLKLKLKEDTDVLPLNPILDPGNPYHNANVFYFFSFSVYDGNHFSFFPISYTDGIGTIIKFNESNLSITGIEEVLKGRFSYYPNPAQSTLNVNVQYGGQGTEQLLLSDLSGKIHIRRQLQPSVQAHRIDISNMAPGVYVLTYRTPEGSLHQKLVVR